MKERRKHTGLEKGKELTKGFIKLLVDGAEGEEKKEEKGKEKVNEERRKGISNNWLVK